MFTIPEKKTIEQVSSLQVEGGKMNKPLFLVTNEAGC